MTKILTRLAFGLWILGAPLMLAGCGEEGSKPADTKPAAPATPAAPPAAPAAPAK